MAHAKRFFDQTVLVFSLSLSIAACSGSSLSTVDGGHDSGASGGSTSTGGKTGTGGSGAGGASVGSGGSSGAGGKNSTGGSSDAGGVDALGGAIASGGATSSGGALGSGGAVATGGSTAAGGAPGTGGKTGTGGAVVTGGSTGSGGSGTGGSTGSGGASGDYGFTYRPVQSKQLDWLCTLNTVGASTYVYVQLDQTGTVPVGIATVPVYTAKLAQISVKGAVTDLANAQYDYGGGHNNDSLQVDYQGKTYKFYHSSFGFGWRQCQPMDCVNILSGSTVQTNGCTSARTLPEVCVQIKADGTHPPLVDTFKKCPGDSNP